MKKLGNHVTVNEAPFLLPLTNVAEWSSNFAIVKLVTHVSYDLVHRLFIFISESIRRGRTTPNVRHWLVTGIIFRVI